MFNILYLVCFILPIWSDYFPGYNAEPIQGGQHDRDNEVIWQVSYQVKRHNGVWSNICGGSIVSSQHIVTAAHCFVQLGKENIKVWDQKKREKTRIVIGTNDLNSLANPGVALKIDKVIIPKEYTRLDDQTLLADVAVVKLRDRIDLSINREKYGPIRLFYPEDEAEKVKYDDQEGFVAGFGAIKVTFGPDGTKTYESDRLRNILPVHLTDYKCPKVRGLRCVRYVKSSRRPKGLCHGDSGGPLYYRNGNEFELVGVISRGPKDCDIRESNKKVEKITFIPDYEDFLKEAKKLDIKTTFPKFSVEEFEKSRVGYIVLPDQAALASMYYVKSIEKKERKKLCNRWKAYI